jgi:hypothetical protein
MDTDYLADYMADCFRGGRLDCRANGDMYFVNHTLREIGMPSYNFSPVTGKNIAYESEVFRFITQRGHIQLDLDTPMKQSIIDSVRALKLDVHR